MLPVCLSSRVRFACMKFSYRGREGGKERPEEGEGREGAHPFTHSLPDPPPPPAPPKAKAKADAAFRGRIRRPPSVRPSVRPTLKQAWSELLYFVSLLLSLSPPPPIFFLPSPPTTSERASRGKRVPSFLPSFLPSCRPSFRLPRNRTTTNWIFLHLLPPPRRH